MINLFKTYNKAKDVFVRPKLVFKFGLWKNVGVLPVWRRGNFIPIAKHKQFYYPKNFVHIKKHSAGDVLSDGTVVKYDTYDIVYHNLPKKYKNGAWNRDIRIKLRKWGLGWLKPNYYLPLWLSFYIFNRDVTYKWKYDDIRYEYPPEFTIVFFGFAFYITLEPQLEDEDDSPYHYWESLLNFLYQCNKNVTETLHYCGQWTTFKNNKDSNFFQLRKTHIKPEYHQEYDEAVLTYNDYLKNKKDDFC
jgi:hypothetical protein